MKRTVLIFVFLIDFIMSQGVKVEEITNEGQRCELMEGPHWDQKTKSLYYVDITSPAIFRYDTKNGEIYKAKIKDNNETLGFIVPIEDRDDEFVVGAGRDITIIRWDGRSGFASVVRVLGEVDKFKSSNRINDGKCDPFGRLYFGTMGDESNDSKTNPTGNFFNFNVEKTFAETLKTSIGISNGLTWNEKLEKFYYIDSTAQDIKVFDYDSLNGNITNESVLYDFKEIFGERIFPDGMTIDENGHLYVATWGGSKVYVIDPQEKKIVREIEMPTTQVTSVAFGGANLDVLYVTTAQRPMPKPAPAGGLFKITGLNVKGLPMNNFKLY